MQAKTHITTTLALGLPLMSLTNELTLVNVGVLAVGSLLPDIDHPSSYLGKRHKMVSGVTNKAFGHRGITHSLLGFILIGIIVKFIQKQYLTDRIENIVFWLMLGYLLHLLEDSFSQRGVHADVQRRAICQCCIVMWLLKIGCSFQGSSTR